MAWRKATRDQFPAPLRLFRERDWPAVPGEHLGHYWCCAPDPQPAPEPGETCGARCYASLAAKSADAFTRYHQARLSWLGEDHPDYVDELFDGDRHDEIRYAPLRAEVPRGVA